MVSGQLTRGSSSVCGTSGCTRTELSAVDRGLFNLANDTAKATLVDWMYGNSGSLRANKKLGDIYHSSPTIVGTPIDDPGDQSYALFRESPVIAERPIITYINTNDGILHAFSLEDYPPQNIVPTVHPGTTLKGGQELWGFVPPILLKDLNNQLSAHRLNLDGTPVVKDVYFSKDTAPHATDYHTVLVTNMRSGGHGYIALDVTDPLDPKFMWQFQDADMGETYGQPELVQAMYEWPAGQPASLRAMAILPGGKGTKGPGPGCSGLTTPSMRVPSSPGTRFSTYPDPDNLSSTQGIMHRAEVQCWNQTGRALYFVDVETGKLIKKIFDTDADTTNGILFPSPLTGSPTAYEDAVGTVATEGFVMDADGVLWRIDLSSKDPRPNDALTGWTVRPFHDVFWDSGPSEGETTYEKPILSLDAKHRLVVIVGTGDTDNFEKPTVKNRAISLTELTTTLTPSLPSDYVAALNWEQRVDGGNGFVDSELVTGTMALFDRQLYMASFISVGDTTNPCSRGLGRLWSFSFNERDPLDPNPVSGSASSGIARTYGPKRLDVVSSDTSGNNADLGLFNIAKNRAEENLLVQGLGTTQRISCEAVGSNINNYFSPALVPIQQQAQPAIWIVAQASSDNKTRTRAGSQLGTLEVKLNRPLEFSKVSSWAGSIE
jgi:type IV pilus assembly protein PilY1